MDIPIWNYLHNLIISKKKRNWYLVGFKEKIKQKNLGKYYTAESVSDVKGRSQVEQEKFLVSSACLPERPHSFFLLPPLAHSLDSRMPLKHSSPDTISSDSVRLLSRETLRISASLASPPPDDDHLHLPLPPPQALPDSHFLHSTLRLICCEEIDGRRWKYVAESDGSGKFKRSSTVRAISLQSPQSPFDVMMI